MATPKSLHIPGQHCIKSWVRPKCQRQLKSHDTYFLCPSVISSSLASFHAGSIQPALTGSFKQCFKFEKNKKNNPFPAGRQTAPNMEEHMASDRWVGWALWQLGVFFMSCCGLFHTVLLSWGKAPTVGCELHRDALCLASSPPCGFRHGPNAHLPSLCPTGELHNSL